MDDSTLGSGLGYFICIPEIEPCSQPIIHFAESEILGAGLSKITARVGNPFDLSVYPSFAYFWSRRKMSQGSVLVVVAVGENLDFEMKPSKREREKNSKNCKNENQACFHWGISACKLYLRSTTAKKTTNKISWKWPHFYVHLGKLAHWDTKTKTIQERCQPVATVFSKFSVHNISSLLHK